MPPTIQTSLVRIQCDPASGTATAFFEKQTTVDGTVFLGAWTPVSWLLADTEQSVVVDGITLTYAQVSAAVTLIAYQAKAVLDAAAAALTPAE